MGLIVGFVGVKDGRKVGLDGTDVGVIDGANVP